MINRGCLSQAGPDGETLYPVDGSIFIGSASDSDVRVKDAAPRQCQVVRTAEGYVLIDLTGQRVTRVNGTRIERHLLQSGEAVTIGSAEFRWTVTAEPEEEEVLVVASTPVRRRPATERAAVPAPASPKSRAIWIGSAVAAGAVVLATVLVFAFSSSSNADRSISRRGIRPARSEYTPSSGAVRETVPVEPSLPRQDPGGVAAAAAAPQKPVVEPAPITIEPFRPALVPELPSVKPALPSAEPPRTRSAFEQRYAALLSSLEKTLARGCGFQAAHKEVVEFSAAGGPRGTADHLKALAASLKDAVACRECSGGKVQCERCGGKGRIDVDCTVCQGQGRVRASGAVGNADVTVKCRNCEGKKVFRGVTCPACGRTGKSTCVACQGYVWPNDHCSRPDCRNGRVPCAQCSGRGWELVKCPFCVNGRQKAPGAVNGADVTMKCRNCEIDGQQGNGMFRAECKACGRTGWFTCDSCGGAYERKQAARASIPAAKVFAAEKCGECAGAGCDRCLGLGRRIRPVSDPSRIIE